MPRINNPREPHSRHLHLVLPDLPERLPPCPAAVPLLRPSGPATPKHDALLTALAQHARQGDHLARDLLWQAFAPRLETILLRCHRLTKLQSWVWHDGCLWDLEDLRQAGWLIFSSLPAEWDGSGSFISYVTNSFPRRLYHAMLRIDPI